MSDATDAILDVIDAITEYGSTITLKSITPGAYDTTTGETADVIADTITKALPKDYKGTELEAPDVYVDDVKFMLYTSDVITYHDKIVYDSVTYNIININKKILQDLNIVYTIQGRA